MEKDCLNIQSYRITANEEAHLVLPEQSYFIILIVNAEKNRPEWRNWICEQIVNSKRCIQAMVTGHECSIWDDVLDETYLDFITINHQSIIAS